MADNAFDQANLAFDQANSAYALAQSASIPAGSNKQVQFNDAGSFAGNSSFIYDKTTSTLTVKNISVDDDITVVNNLNISGDIVPNELGQNIGLPGQRWYNMYVDGGIYANGTFGNPGQVLSTDGYGIVRWIDPPSANIDGNVTVYAIDPYARSTANAAEILAQSAFNKANASSSSGVDQYARNTANTAYNNTILINGVNLTQNTNINKADVKAQASFDKANSVGNDVIVVGTYANTGITLAQAAFDKANTGGSGTGVDQYARDTANSAYNSTVFLQNVNNAQNTSITNLNTFTQAAFNQANAAITTTIVANAAFAQANAAFIKANNSGIVAQSAYDSGNNTLIYAQAAYAYANLISGGTAADGWARNQANAAFAQANTAYTSAGLAVVQSLLALNSLSTVFAQANSAYDTANTKVSKSGDTMTGVLNISNSTSSTSVTTGALQVTGGVGVSGNVYASMFYSNNYAGTIDAGSF